MTQNRTFLLGAAGLTAIALALACGGGSSSSAPAPVTPAHGTVGFLTTDATSETWSSVGIIVRKASLVLASDTAAADPVMIYDGSQDTTPVNFLQEDAINDLLSQATNVPAGVYDRLIVEVDGSAANISLVPAADPATGIVPAAIPAADLFVKGNATDAANPTWMVLPTITLASPVTVAADQAAAVAVDFDLAHPAFIVQHDTGSNTVYVVNFKAKGPFRHKPAAALDHYYLRRHLGTVTSVASDLSSMTMLTEHGQTLTLKADAASGSLFYNLDGTTPGTPVKGEAMPAALVAGDAVECTARMQADGTLTSVRVWFTTGAASTLPRWTPEGHVVKVDAGNDLLYVLDSAGSVQPITIGAGTQWFYHGGATDLSGGTGSAFLPQIGRFFKVHVLVDPLSATPTTALSVDIQRAVYEGSIVQNPAPTATSFQYFKVFSDATTVTRTLGYDSAFSFWDFTFPGTAATDLGAFVAEADSSIVKNNAGTLFMPYGSSSLNWEAATSTWGAVDTIFMPIQLSAAVQTVQTAYAPPTGSATVGTLTVQAAGANTLPVNVTLDPTSQEQPLVTLYQRAGATVTVTPVAAADWATSLAQGALVRVYGVPDGNGNLKAYYVNIYM